MKKIIFLILFVAFLCVNLSARAWWTIGGVKVGLNSASMNYSYKTNWDREALSGLFLCFFAEEELNKIMSFQGEFSFSQKGTIWKDPDTTDIEKWRLNYYESSANFIFGYPLKEKIYPAAYMGAYLAVHLWSTRIFNPGTSAEEKSSMGDEIGILDYGLLLGGRLEYRFHRLPLRTGVFIEVRYQWGLANVYKFAEYLGEGYAGESAKNRVLAILIGFKL